MIGNKQDLVEAGQTPEVSAEDIEAFEKRTGKKIHLASAKSGANVEATFLHLTDKLIAKHQP